MATGVGSEVNDFNDPLVVYYNKGQKKRPGWTGSTSGWLKRNDLSELLGGELLKIWWCASNPTVSVSRHGGGFGLLLLVFGERLELAQVVQIVVVDGLVWGERTPLGGVLHEGGSEKLNLGDAGGELGDAAFGAAVELEIG